MPGDSTPETGPMKSPRKSRTIAGTCSSGSGSQVTVNQSTIAPPQKLSPPVRAGGQGFDSPPARASQAPPGVWRVCCCRSISPGGAIGRPKRPAFMSSVLCLSCRNTRRLGWFSPWSRCRKRPARLRPLTWRFGLSALLVPAGFRHDSASPCLHRDLGLSCRALCSAFLHPGQYGWIHPRMATPERIPVCRLGYPFSRPCGDLLTFSMACTSSTLS